MIMETNLASQFPDALNRIELRAVRRQEIQSQFSPMVPQPGSQRPSMMISRIIQEVIGNLLVPRLCDLFSDYQE